MQISKTTRWNMVRSGYSRRRIRRWNSHGLRVREPISDAQRDGRALKFDLHRRKLQNWMLVRKGGRAGQEANLVSVPERDEFARQAGGIGHRDMPLSVTTGRDLTEMPSRIRVWGPGGELSKKQTAYGPAIARRAGEAASQRKPASDRKSTAPRRAAKAGAKNGVAGTGHRERVLRYNRHCRTPGRGALPVASEQAVEAGAYSSGAALTGDG